MKSLFGTAIIAAMAFALAACSAAPSRPVSASSEPSSTSAGKSQSSGKKVLFIGRESGGDAIVAKRLRQTHGMDVTIVSDKEVKAEQAKGYTLIFVSESVNSGKIKDMFVKTAVPVIYDEPQVSGDTGMTDVDANGKLQGPEAAKTIQIANAKHPLAAGLDSQVDVYKENGKMSYATPGKEAIVVATVPNDAQKATIFAYDKGATNVKGEPVTAREVFFYLMEGEEINQTDSGWKLFDAAVRWATDKK